MTSLLDVMSTRVDNSGLPDGRLQSPIAPKELRSLDQLSHRSVASIYSVLHFHTDSVTSKHSHINKCSYRLNTDFKSDYHGEICLLKCI